MLRFVGVVVVVTLVLFVWSGVSQQLPWGVPTVKNVQAVEGPVDDFAQTPTTVLVPPDSLTTPAFDAELGHGLATLTTRGAFAWVVSIPREAYDPGRYLAFEFVAQLAVALLLVSVTWLVGPLGARRRIAVVGVMSVGASVATWGVLANWWGVPLAFASGMALNLTIGWVIAASVSARLLRAPRST